MTVNATYNDVWWRATVAQLRRVQAPYIILLEDDVEVNQHLQHNVTTWAALRDPLFGAGYLCVADGVLHDTARLGRGTSGEHFRDARMLHNAGGVVVRPDLIEQIFLDCTPFRPYLASDFFFSRGSFDRGLRAFLHQPSLVRMDMSVPSVIGCGQTGDAGGRGSGMYYSPDWRRDAPSVLEVDVIVSEDGVESRIGGTPDDWIIKHLGRSAAFYEVELLRRIRDLGLEGVYVDVGAHVGNHAVYFATHCPGATRIVAVEPQPRCYLSLVDNLGKCGVPYDVVFGAVHDTWSTVSLHVRSEWNLGATQVVGGGDTPCWRLDDVCCDFDPVLIKIDAEGTEPAVLRSGEQTLARAEPVLVTEAWTLEALQAARASVAVPYEVYGPFTGDGTYIWIPVSRSSLVTSELQAHRVA